ncbi:hypothetical protein GOP47_0000950 [Adiantum capillus-veneris]|uniref:Growth arrest-specific protein 8 domain-containing protein n=1 Tax=Adiantum capillus-veneris TaxID=13818 RepID=A0A9D4VDY3_ADICA|nr:hypothetical protein GOP47_0000950 [Adiantum capillus-veneris]
MGPKKEPLKKSSAAGKDKPAAPKKKKSKGDATDGDGDKPVLLSPKEMKGQLESLQADKMREEQERNFVQLERDKIASFLEIKKKELEQAKVELRIKDRNLEEMEERHQDEIKVYNQKMKHLLYEQHNNIAAVKAEHEVALKLLREQTTKREMELLSEQLGLKEKIRELELAYEDTIKQVKLDHGKELTKMKQEYDVGEKELQTKTEKKIKCIRDDCELRRKQEVHEVEERKNTHINELMKKHEKAFTEIKCYYNDITQNNLDLIKTLKEDVTDMKKKEAANEKLMYDIAQENKRLTEPLTRALKEVETLKKQLANYEKDKLSLQQARTALAEHSKMVKNLEFEKGALQQKFDEVTSERDELYKRFENGVFELQKKSNLKNLLIQRKVQVLEETLEKKDAQIGEVLAFANRDPNVIQHAKDNVNHTIDSKNKEIRQLRYELGRLTKAYKDLSVAFKTKLVQYKIPLQEMGLPFYASEF